MEEVLPCVKKSALFEHSELADYSKEDLLPRRMAVQVLTFWLLLGQVISNRASALIRPLIP